MRSEDSARESILGQYIDFLHPPPSLPSLALSLTLPAQPTTRKAGPRRRRRGGAFEAGSDKRLRVGIDGTVHGTFIFSSALGGLLTLVKEKF